VQENLELGAYSRKADKQMRDRMEEMYQLFPRLGERKKQYAGTMSGGEQQMLAIARALMSRPKLLLMDEPSMGLAPVLVDFVFETIQRIQKEGYTILLVEQNAHMALQIANRGYVLQSGKIVLADTAERLRKDPAVQATYLGI
jgi:branched-chain amino acid transport system ATP-binding protein